MSRTPAPWKAKAISVSPGFNGVKFPPINHIFSTNLFPIAKVDNLDDAVLMATAPELLEACEKALYWMSAYLPWERQPPSIMENLQKVIFKAKGEDQGDVSGIEDDPEKLGLTDQTFGDQ
jgi:hypothetical protein